MTTAKGFEFPIEIEGNKHKIPLTCSKTKRNLVALISLPVEAINPKTILEFLVTQKLIKHGGDWKYQENFKHKDSQVIAVRFEKNKQKIK